MREPNFEAADLWSQLRAAYADYKNAKMRQDTEAMKKLEVLIKELESKLDFKDEKESYKEGA